jgi:hypothetical protein
MSLFLNHIFPLIYIMEIQIRLLGIKIFPIPVIYGDIKNQYVGNFQEEQINPLSHQLFLNVR